MVLWWWYKICCHYYCTPRFNRRNNVNDKIFIKTWQYIKSTIWALGNIWRHTLTGLCLKTRQKLKRESTRECLADFSTRACPPSFEKATETIHDLQARRQFSTDTCLPTLPYLSRWQSLSLISFCLPFTGPLLRDRHNSVYHVTSRYSSFVRNENGRLNLKVRSSIGWHLGKSRCPFHFIISSITWWFCQWMRIMKARAPPKRAILLILGLRFSYGRKWNHIVYNYTSLVIILVRKLHARLSD